MKLKANLNLRQFALAAVALLIIAYIVLQLVLSVGTIVNVQAAEYIEVTDTLNLSACIFRDETVMFNPTHGTVCYLVDDYEKVTAGQAVASVYDVADDAGVQASIKELNDRISLLEKSSASSSTTDMSVLDSKINSLFLSSIQNTQAGIVSNAIRNRDELLIYMNRRVSVVSTVDTFELQIRTLQNEIKRLEASIRGNKTSLTSPTASWFVSFTDGYESYFTQKALKDLTIESYEELLTQQADEELKESALGKLYNDSEWSIVVRTDKRTAIEYKAGKSYDVSFPYSLGTSIKMKYVRAVSQTNTNDVLMIFSTRVNYEGFNFLRYQPVQIAFKTYSGLRVPRSAVRVKDGVQGVYVLDGNVIKFKRIDIVYEQANHYICKLPDSADRSAISDTDLSLYDLIIIEGKQIYEGRVLS